MNEAVFSELALTCGSWQEAQKIADHLLDKHLVACAEFMEVKSRYRWHGTLAEGDEVKLLLQTTTDKFNQIEAEVKKLHSYETFNLHATPLAHVSQAAQVWLRQETTNS